MNRWHKWPLAYIIYTDNLHPTVGGTARGMVIRIKPRYYGDIGIHKHELKHVGLFWMTLGLHIFLRKIRRYRLWNEARAYYEQSKWPNLHGNFMTKEQAVVHMANHERYNFKMTEYEIREYLTLNFPRWGVQQ